MNPLTDPTRRGVLALGATVSLAPLLFSLQSPVQQSRSIVVIKTELAGQAEDHMATILKRRSTKGCLSQRLFSGEASCLLIEEWSEPSLGERKGFRRLDL